MNFVRNTGIALATLVAIGHVGGRARAQAAPADCDLTGTVVYGVGGSAQLPLIGKIAAQLAGASDPIKVIYAAPGACAAMTALDPSKSAADRKVTGVANYWTPGNEKAQTCQLPAAGVDITFGSMQNGATLCTGVTKLFDGVGDFEGPIGTINFIVPANSSEDSISAEAAHFVFGWGAESKVEPWTVNDLIARRNDQSAVQLYVGLAVDVPATKFQGLDQKTQGQVISTVAGAPSNQRDAAIGIVSGEAADAARKDVKTLAYQHVGQDCGYWPDSSGSDFDKINVRDGHYFLWGTTHFFAAVDGDKKISDANTKVFVDYVTGAATPDGLAPPVDLFIDNGNVPQCAMRVKRTGDLGPLSSFQPDAPCGCYFESRATGSSSCDGCSEDDGKTSKDCPKSAPICRHNFCEVK